MNAGVPDTSGTTTGVVVPDVDSALDGVDGLGEGVGQVEAEVFVADELAQRRAGVDETEHWYPQTLLKFHPLKFDEERI